LQIKKLLVDRPKAAFMLPCQRIVELYNSTREEKSNGKERFTTWVRAKILAVWSFMTLQSTANKKVSQGVFIGLFYGD
jgi:hypothetical protein